MLNNPYKLLLIDIDGTLLGRAGTILPEDREAVARACDLGIKVSLSTGRTPLSSLKIVNQLSLDGYHIFCDGALVSNPNQNKEAFVRPIRKAVVRRAIEFAHEHDINLELFSITRYLVEHETWASEIRRQFFGIQATVISFTNLWRRDVIIKGTLVVSSVEERAKADSLCFQFKDDLDFSWTETPAYPGVDFLNIVAPGVSKGKALEALASYLAIPLSEVMAIGDADNDIPLFATAGLSIAMGNASDEVKAVADCVTLDIDHGGVAVAIKKFLL